MRFNVYFTEGLILSAILFSFPSYGQNTPDGVFDLGFEFQAYPTGLIYGLHLEKGFARRNALHFRAGYNRVRHGDAGKHEDERGGGFGFTFGYSRFFSDDFKGFYAGLRNGFWFNTIDWKDNIGKA